MVGGWWLRVSCIEYRSIAMACVTHRLCRVGRFLEIGDWDHHESTCYNKKHEELSKSVLFPFYPVEMRHKESVQVPSTITRTRSTRYVVLIYVYIEIKKFRFQK